MKMIICNGLPNVSYGQKPLPLQKKGWNIYKTGANQGWFVLEAKATDQNGNEVLDKKYIRLSSFKSTQRHCPMNIY